jgi:hypothetical protein
MPDLQEANLYSSSPSSRYRRGKDLVATHECPEVAALALSLAARANQSAVSPVNEPLSVTDNLDAIGRNVGASALFVSA